MGVLGREGSMIPSFRYRGWIYAEGFLSDPMGLVCVRGRSHLICQEMPLLESERSTGQKYFELPYLDTAGYSSW